MPVFVRGLASWGEGVGERLVPVSLEEPWYVLVVLPFAVSTAGAFRAPALTRNTPRIRMKDLLRGETGAPESPARIERLLTSARNDCEPVVREMHPEVGEALDWLSEHARARMTGTGATVFAPFRSRERAVRGCGSDTPTVARAGDARAEPVAAAPRHPPGRHAVSAFDPFSHLGV